MNWKDFGFFRVALAETQLVLANPRENRRRILSCAHEAVKQNAEIVVFPELSLTGYSCEDLFHNMGLLQQVENELVEIVKESEQISIPLVIGTPFRWMGCLYNLALVIFQGKVVAGIPKVHLPGYDEFYEQRWFTSGEGVQETVNHSQLGSWEISTKQIIKIGDITLGVEICEDAWAPIPVSAGHVVEGAQIICNLSASNELVGKSKYRRNLVSQLSAQYLCGYVYVSSGLMESTKDIVFGGHTLAAENGVVLLEERNLSGKGQLYCVDFDIEKLERERLKNTTFSKTISIRRTGNYTLHTMERSTAELSELKRVISSHPFVPFGDDELGERAAEIFQIQSAGLMRRMIASRARSLVLGVSGGLDSTLALLVAVESARLMGQGAELVCSVTMPGYATSSRTKGNAEKLAALLGTEFLTIDIAKSVSQHLSDINHLEGAHDVTYENAQARERTQVLFDLANKQSGIVVGTGDMSELALGWCTYNGDHMSSYNVNVSIPKTLIQHLIRWYAVHKAGSELRKVLEDILDTPISPELIPGKKGEISQVTEEIIGPYELHDFFLFHFIRHGFGVNKIYHLAVVAYSEGYEPEEIKKWLKVFVQRFFANQFKRTVLPAGPKVGTVSLSPRGDWRMPDEADASFLLEQIEKL